MKGNNIFEIGKVEDNTTTWYVSNNKWVEKKCKYHMLFVNDAGTVQFQLGQYCI